MKRVTYAAIAERDFRNAYLMLRESELNDAARYVSQSVEKNLKHIINEHADNDYYPLSTHNLPVIARRVEELLGTKYSREDHAWFRSLKSWYYDTNYPGDNYVELVQEELDELFAWFPLFTEKVKAQIRAQTGFEGDDKDPEVDSVAESEISPLLRLSLFDPSDDNE